MVEGAPNEKPASWEVSFARSGVPLHLAPSNRGVSAPELSYLKSGRVDARYLTGDVTWQGAAAVHI